MPSTLGRILVPVDFSAGSNDAVAQATTLAKRLGGSIELLHVVEDPIMSGAWSSEIYVPDLPQLLAQLKAESDERLEELRSKVAKEGVPVTALTIVGRPARSILEHAANGDFGLIVMGTHGRTGISHLLLGSVAERVVRGAPCPVMTVREGTTSA